MTQPSQPDTDSSTPIPWAIQEASKGPDRDYGIKANGGIIAEVFEHGGSQYEMCVDAEANAAFIVRAVNNHAKLLKALKRILGESHNPVVERIAQDAIDEAKS